MPSRLLALGLTLSLPALAACGSNAPSKAEYLAKADPICKRGNEIATVFTVPSDLPMIKDFATKLADNADKTAKALDELDTPSGDDGKAAKAFVKALRDAAGAARAVPAEVDAGNFTNVESASTRMIDAFKAADSQARSFGSTECGKGEGEVITRYAQTMPDTVKKAYIAKADPICAAGNKEFDALAEPESMAELRTYLDRALGLLQKLVNDIKAVPAPAKDKPTLDEMFLTLDQSMAKMRELQTAANANNARQVGQLSDELVDLGDRANAKADAYGFKDCGSQGG